LPAALETDVVFLGVGIAHEPREWKMRDEGRAASRDGAAAKIRNQENSELAEGLAGGV
jgi:hypothetical protein